MPKLVTCTGYNCPTTRRLRYTPSCQRDYIWATPILAVTHTPLLYSANYIQSDRWRGRKRYYSSCSNDLFVLANEQLYSRLPMTRRPNTGAGVGCYLIPPKFNSMLGPLLLRLLAFLCRCVCTLEHLIACWMWGNWPLSSTMTLPVKVGSLGLLSRVTGVHGHSGQFPKVG